MRADGSDHRLAQIFARSNDSFLAAAAQKAQHGFDFWAHVSGREMAAACVLLQLRRSNLSQRTLRGFL